jgi:type IV secretory pathway VirJ component
MQNIDSRLRSRGRQDRAAVRIDPVRRVILFLGCLFFAATLEPVQAESLAHGRFQDVEVYRPAGTVRQVALFLSGDAGWDRGMVSMASQLAGEGTLVLGVDVPKFLASLEEDDGECVSPDGDLENLSHFAQAYYRLPTYFTPLLVGYSSGSTLAYATLAQAPRGIFAGALSLSFCPELDLARPLCKSGSLQYSMSRDGEHARLAPPARLHAPWVVLQGETDTMCPAAQARQFVSDAQPARYVEVPGVGHDLLRSPQWRPQFQAAYATLLASGPRSVPPPPPGLSDLPLIEMPATGTGDLFAVFLSGDGGWAGLDKQVAKALADRGIPVVGMDSLRYFWKERTPEGLAADIDRLVRFYARQWKKKRVLLIGYSQGADVLPFAVNRLPATTRELVQLTTLIGLSETAAFEFHVANWFGGSGDQPVKPETNRLSAADTLCIHGEDDDESLCPTIGAEHAKVVNLRGGHHFGGDYRKLTELIVNYASPR